MAGARALADLLRSVQELELNAEQERAAARMLGFRQVTALAREPEDEETSAPGLKGRTDGQQERAHEESAEPAATPAISPAWRDDEPESDTRVESIPRDEPTPPPWFERAPMFPQQDKRWMRNRPRAAPTLLPATWARRTLAQLLSRTPATGPPDIPRVILRLARREVAARLPRLRRPRLTNAVQLLVDNGDGMAPYRDDQLDVVARIRQLFPRSALRVLYFEGSPLHGVRYELEIEESPYSLPPRGSAVLVLSDLGANSGEWNRDGAWFEWSRKLRAHRCSPMALFPFPAERASPRLREELNLRPWEQPEPPRFRPAYRALHLSLPLAFQGWGERNPQALHLALHLSLASRMEPALLRAVRRQLLPDAPASVEADLWFSPLIDDRSRLFASLEPDAADSLRAQLARDPDRLSSTRKLIERIHAYLPPLARMEERILYLATAQPDGYRERIQQETQPLLLSLDKQPKRRPGLAVWCGENLARLPDAARTGFVSLAVAASHLVRHPGQPVPIDLSTDTEPMSADGSEYFWNQAGRVPVHIDFRDGWIRIVDGKEGVDETIPDTAPRVLELISNGREPRHLTWAPGASVQARVSPPFTLRALDGSGFRLAAPAIGATDAGEEPPTGLVAELTAAVADQRRAWEAMLVEQGFTVPEDPLLDRTLERVWEASDYVATSCIRHPRILPGLIDSGRLVRAYEEGETERLLVDSLEGVADKKALGATLRRFRCEQMVRIIWRDIGSLAGLDETLEDLSALADACVDHALKLLHRWTVAELGTPRDAEGAEQKLVVLGMGKLGAQELNLSSDIDLIFAYTANGQTDGPRPLSNEQFFVRLARRLVQALDTATVDGFVFRVDTRLRPFGDAGPLAMSFAAMEDYYQTQAREWERYAMIKARVVAGDSEAGRRLINMLRPFVYRRYMDFGAIESLRDMKQMIYKEPKRKSMADNVKLGPGGIREIEFIGQAFQLIRGGRDPDLQICPIRSVLRLLGEKGLLPEHALKQLDEAYEFLRLVENRLQARADKQTHLLPEDDLGRLRLARSMDFERWEGFLDVLDAHRRLVQEQFDAIFAAPGDEATQEDPFSTIWIESTDEAHARELLASAGFEDPEGTLGRLKAMREAAARKGLSKRGGDRMAQLVPLVLQVAAGSESPDLVLERMLRVLESILRHTACLAMLVEHPIVLSQLARLAEKSPWFSDQIGHHPLLLDEFLDSRRLYAPLHRADLEEELDSLLVPVGEEDLEQQMERLRQFTQGNILRVAAADLTEAIPLMVVSDYLTVIAEVSVSRVLALTHAHLREKHGQPGGIEEGGKGFLVLGYGKLGGIELGYSSDLDLVFLHGSESVNAMTGGERAISNDQFFMRLGQRMIHMMTTQTTSGQLYEVDMRLRPDGNNGMLVRSLKSFAEYQRRDAWTWEHQALIRARPVAGDAALAERFARVRREVLCMDREPDGLRAQVREAREKMRGALDKTRDGRFDLKQGYGGIADIEFMVQYSVMRRAARYPELTDWTDNVRQLETLARLDLMPGNAAQDLTAAYKDLRAACNRSALQEQRAWIPDDALVDQRKLVRALWRELMEG